MANRTNSKYVTINFHVEEAARLDKVAAALGMTRNMLLRKIAANGKVDELRAIVNR